MALLQPWLERPEELPLHVDMDKAWSRSTAARPGTTANQHLDIGAGEYPLNLVVLGGEQLLEKGYRSAALILATDVPRGRGRWRGSSGTGSGKRFFALPDTQFHEINEEIFGMGLGALQGLAPVLRRGGGPGQARSSARSLIDAEVATPNHPLLQTSGHAPRRGRLETHGNSSRVEARLAVSSQTSKSRLCP